MRGEELCRRLNRGSFCIQVKSESTAEQIFVCKTVIQKCSRSQLLNYFYFTAFLNFIKLLRVNDALWFFEDGSPMERQTKIYDTSPESCIHGAVTKVCFTLIATVHLLAIRV